MSIKNIIFSDKNMYYVVILLITIRILWSVNYSTEIDKYPSLESYHISSLSSIRIRHFRQEVFLEFIDNNKTIYRADCRYLPNFSGCESSVNYRYDDYFHENNCIISFNRDSFYSKGLKDNIYFIYLKEIICEENIFYENIYDFKFFLIKNSRENIGTAFIIIVICLFFIVGHMVYSKGDS